MGNLKKSILVLMGCILILMSASCAFAGESNQTHHLEDVENCEMNLNAETELTVSPEFERGEEGLYNSTENFAEIESGPDVIPASYDDLCHDIENLKPDSTYDIKKDYIIEDCGEDLSKNRIIRITADNVVINGNGHTINANGINGYFGVFEVTGKNVTIMNLNIVNARIYDYAYSISSWNRYGKDYNKVLSPIEWYGDNGLLLNCVFDDNVGEDGGAVYWAGNNGVIDNCYFNDNAAARGGSIFVCGYNNTIRNSIIKDSYSDYFDAIFIKNFDENGKLLQLNLNNCTFENSMSFIHEFHVEGECAIIQDNRQIFPIIPPGPYSELCEIIKNLKDGDVYILNKDYYYDQNSYYYPIMANNVVIDGNGHKIYGSDVLVNSLIWVTGNNVTVKNLKFEFNDLKDGSYGASFVEWKGNNGFLENCSFIGNRARYGGAVIWQGNGGIIDRCAFVNNTAYLSGGAIFISGENNRIIYSLILNSHSELSGESIFIDNKRNNLTMEDVFFNLEGIPLFDAGKIDCNINFNIDDVLDSKYYSSIGNEKILINELIYLSLLKGGTIYLNDQISYYSRYFNESGDFILTVTKNYNQHGISYVQEYHFKNIFNNAFSDIFTKLRSGDFETTITLTKTAYIFDESGYYIILGEFYAMISFIPIMGDLNNDINFIGKNIISPITHVFNVVFNRTLTINSRNTWNMEESPYDMLVINGAGSTIRASFDDSEEDKWVVLSEGKTFYAYNITLEGFNTVIENMGGECMLDHLCFRSNRMDYLIDRDWGAAILNCGVCICNQCSFEYNYAKHGGAIFNQGYLVLDNCTFAGNHAYGEGDDVCNANGGVVLFDGVDIKESTAYVTCVESIAWGWQVLIEISAFVVSFVAGFVAGFFTANPVIGVAVGALVGAGLGIGSSAILIAFSYDAKMNRLSLAMAMTVGCMVVGALGGIIGSAVSPYGIAQFEVDAGAVAEANPEIVEFIEAPERASAGIVGPAEDAVSEFSVYSDPVLDVSIHLD